ncbi:hypothetical protein ACFE04_015573 [Oxalis oulophora]
MAPNTGEVRVSSAIEARVNLEEGQPSMLETSRTQGSSRVEDKSLQDRSQIKAVAKKKIVDEDFVRGYKIRVSEFQRLLVSFNHVRGHATPTDLEDKDVDGLVSLYKEKVVLLDELNRHNVDLISKVLDLEALCAQAESDASSAHQLVVERDLALVAQASHVVVESLKKENAKFHKAYGR